MRYMNSSAIDIIDEALLGRISLRHAQMALEASGIFGAFRDGEFHGHDFRHGQPIDRARNYHRRPIPHFCKISAK